MFALASAAVLVGEAVGPEVSANFARVARDAESSAGGVDALAPTEDQERGQTVLARPLLPLEIESVVGLVSVAQEHVEPGHVEPGAAVPDADLHPDARR